MHFPRGERRRFRCDAALAPLARCQSYFGDRATLVGHRGRMAPFKRRRIDQSFLSNTGFDEFGCEYPEAADYGVEEARVFSQLSNDEMGRFRVESNVVAIGDSAALAKGQVGVALLSLEARELQHNRRY